MQIFRVEDIHGVGYYTSKLNRLPIYDVKGSYHPRSEPQYDGIPRVTENQYFGFESLDSLYAWFPKEHIDKISDDFQIVVYSVQKRYVRFGKTQVVFKMDKARKLFHI